MPDSWKLIKTAREGLQRYYQLGFRVRNIFIDGAPFTIKRLFEADPMVLSPRYELAEDVSESIDKVCISDAHTHAERLVFPAFHVKDVSSGEVLTVHRYNNIDGRHTMMIQGGNSRYVYDDRTYLRHLRAANREYSPCR